MVELSRFSLGVKIAALVVFVLLFLISTLDYLPYNQRRSLRMFLIIICMPILMYIIWQGVMDDVEGGPFTNPFYVVR